MNALVLLKPSGPPGKYIGIVFTREACLGRLTGTSARILAATSTVRRTNKRHTTIRQLRQALELEALRIGGRQVS